MTYLEPSLYPEKIEDIKLFLKANRMQQSLVGAYLYNFESDIGLMLNPSAFWQLTVSLHQVEHLLRIKAGQILFITLLLEFFSGVS